MLVFNSSMLNLCFVCMYWGVASDLVKARWCFINSSAVFAD